MVSLSNLALTYDEQGEHQKALELRKKAYKLRCKVLEKEHPDTLMSINNLVSMYNEQDSGRKRYGGLLRRLWNWMKSLRK